jgi:hypothetical protein
VGKKGLDAYVSAIIDSAEMVFSGAKNGQKLMKIYSNERFVGFFSSVWNKSCSFAAKCI